MTKPDRFAGLLRVRESLETQAASRLAVANAGVRQHAERRRQLHNDVSESPQEAVDSTTLLAIAAARASARSLLAEATAHGARLDEVAVDAAEHFRKVRRDAVVLRKLDERQRLAAAHEQLAREQAVLDEASQRRRAQEGTA